MRHPQNNLDQSAATRPALTARAFAIGLAACVAISLAFPYENLMIKATRPANTSLPYGSIFILFVIVVGLNPLLRVFGSALRRDELVVVFVMILISTAIPTWGLMAQLLSILPGPAYYASAENHWGATILPYVPSWIAPTDPDGIRHFYEGLPAGQNIPWSIWIVPLFWWGVLVAAFFTVTGSMMVILERQWRERERLIFPLMHLPLAMVDDDEAGARLPAFFRSRAMWIGFALVFALSSVNALHSYNHLFPYMKLRGGIAFLRRAVYLRTWLNFAVVGFTFLIHSDVAFSLWFFSVLSSVQIGLFNIFGFSIGPREIYCSGAPSVSNQAMGGMIALVAYCLWTARDHIKDVLRSAWAGTRTDNDVVSCRAAVVSLVLGLSMTALWLHASGLPWVGVVVFLMGTFVTFLALTRAIAQGGVLVSRAALTPASFTVHALGPETLGPAGMTSIGFAFSWTADIRVFFMPFFVHALHLWKTLGARRRGFVAAAVSAVAVSAGVSAWIILKLAYTHGGVNLSGWLFRGCPTVPFYYITARTANPDSAAAWRYAFLAGGAGIMALLMFCQYRFTWWMLHPLGFAIGPTQPVKDLWFSIFLGWLLKVLLLRLGGLSLIRRATPFVLGGVLGQFVACGVWATIDGLLGHQGNSLYVY